MKLFVAIPAYDCKVHIGTSQALASEAALALAAGIGMRIAFQPGMSLVHAARNLLCDEFLNSDCTHLVFVDADCGWNAGDLIRLAARGRHIVAGACRRRREPEDYAYDPTPYASIHDGLIEVDGIGMAFTCISREALERMRRAAPDRAYMVEDRVLHGFFDSPVVGGYLLGEDIAFCRQWKALGGQVFVDITITLQHLEGLQTFTGNFGEWLSKEKPV